MYIDIPLKFEGSDKRIIFILLLFFFFFFFEKKKKTQSVLIEIIQYVQYL